MCQIWTKLTFYTSFETYTCFYNAPSIEMLHYKIFSLNKYRFSYTQSTSHNITFLHVTQTSNYGMTQKMCGNATKNWQSWNYAQSPLLSSFNEFSFCITKYRQKSWKMQWLTTKVNIPILQHTRKIKNWPSRVFCKIWDQNAWNMLWFLLPLLYMLSNTYEAVSTPLQSTSQQCIKKYTSTAELH